MKHGSEALWQGAWLASAVVALCVALLSYVMSPAVVPIHFGPGGIPDAWGNRSVLLEVYIGLIAGTFLLFGLMPRIIRHGPTWCINLPNKEYWLAPEHRAEAAARFAAWSHVYGFGFYLFLIVVQGAVLNSLLSEQQRLPPQLLGLATFGFVVFTLGSCLWLVSSFRLPRTSERPRQNEQP